jgi:alpha 1,2-mannosyltransferase
MTHQISLHYILSFSHDSYGRATSLSNIASKFKSPASSAIDSQTSTQSESTPSADYTAWNPSGSANETHSPDSRANATFVILCRNSDLQSTVQSIREVEDRFNRRYQYPYVLLNEVEFTEDFKRCVLNVPILTPSFGLRYKKCATVASRY